MPRTFVWHPGKGPARTGKNELTTGKVRIKQVRSEIGHSWRMRRTLEAIGLKHHQDEVVQQDSPSLRGQLKQVRHLVEVTPVEE
jgi:large subunit ribosomal protein L30